MKVGLTGFPGAGKTTVFNALTGLHAASAGPGLNLGVIKVPDARVDALAAIYTPRKTTYAEVSFVDFPPARSAPERRTVLDAATVAQLRDADALVEVVRGFPDLAGAPPTPAADLEGFAAELVLADLAVVEKRLERVRKEKGHERERALLERLAPSLEAGTPLRTLGLALIAAGAALSASSVFLMGRAWRIGIDPENRTDLADEGPYRWIRHPIYSGWLVMLVGHVLVVPYPVVDIAALLTTAGVVVEALREERHLHRTFGERWVRYARATGRFAPHLWGVRR
jgi:hypothetical protein